MKTGRSGGTRTHDTSLKRRVPYPSWPPIDVTVDLDRKSQIDNRKSHRWDKRGRERHQTDGGQASFVKRMRQKLSTRRAVLAAQRAAFVFG